MIIVLSPEMPSVFCHDGNHLKKQSVGAATLPSKHHLVGLVVKASTSRAEDPGFESPLRRDFFGVESYQ